MISANLILVLEPVRHNTMERPYSGLLWRIISLIFGKKMVVGVVKLELRFRRKAVVVTIRSKSCPPLVHDPMDHFVSIQIFDGLTGARTFWR